MKKIFLIILNLLLIGNCFSARWDTGKTDDGGNYHSVMSEKESNVLQASSISNGRIITHGGQQGIAGEGSGIANVINSDSKTTDQATDDVIKYISAFINWALGMAFVVALAFLIYNGYLVVTAAGNDAQYKKGISYIRYMAIALVGIGLSFFIVQFIFAMIFKVT